MSHIRGRFGIDVQFTDSTTVGGAKSLKTITLQHSTEYDFGKVAVVTGTVSTQGVAIETVPSVYVDSSGSTVSFASVSRIAFSASGDRLVKCEGNAGDMTLFSRANQVAISETTDATQFDVNVEGTAAGTASYTLVMYGA